MFTRLLTTFICIIFLIGVTPATAKALLDGPYKAEILRVIDGDTVEARIHIWLDQYLVRLVRLDGINAPELRGKCHDEKIRAKQAKDYLTNLLTTRDITLSNVQQDKYGGRIVARINYDGQDISSHMIAARHAVSYDGGRRTDWCNDEFASTE